MRANTQLWNCVSELVTRPAGGSRVVSKASYRYVECEGAGRRPVARIFWHGPEELLRSLHIVLFAAEVHAAQAGGQGLAEPHMAHMYPVAERRLGVPHSEALDGHFLSYMATKGVRCSLCSPTPLTCSTAWQCAGAWNADHHITPVDTGTITVQTVQGRRLPAVTIVSSRRNELSVSLECTPAARPDVAAISARCRVRPEMCR